LETLQEETLQAETLQADTLLNRGITMNTARALSRVPSGPRTKWLVLVFWLIVVAVLGPLAGKLTNAEKNDASAWLPGNAESTKVVNLQASYLPPNLFPGVVVYSRPGGLTPADWAKAAADARAFASLPGVLASRRHEGNPQLPGNPWPGRHVGFDLDRCQITEHPLPATGS